MNATSSDNHFTCPGFLTYNLKVSVQRTSTLAASQHSIFYYLGVDERKEFPLCQQFGDGVRCGVSAK
jgi:hypothetical protein